MESLRLYESRERLQQQHDSPLELCCERNALTVNFKCFSFLKYQSPSECGCVHSFLLIELHFQRFLTESSR